MSMLNPYYHKERQLQALYARRNTYRKLLMDPVQDADGHYDQQLITGLCPKQDSCDICREARRACPKYQAFLCQSRALDIATNWGVESWNHSHASYTGGNVVGILDAWIARGTAALDAYRKKYLPK